MTAPLRGTPRLSAVPATQNTAPVHEFRCLFTHDVRRKQKRWQDGYLKFHTFNNRVMVYDTSRNFLGDTYWKESNELHEGDELTLDKPVMVEVADAVGVTQTDLTPLFEKKKESPQRPNPVSAQRPSKPTAPAGNPPRPGSQLRHKSLNTLLGAPKGPIGKSVPIRSPYEARQEKENQPVNERANKRQKITHAPANGLSTLPLPASAMPNKSMPISERAPGGAANRAAPKYIPPGAVVLALSSDTDNMASDVTLPITPPRMDNLRPTVKATAPPSAFSTPRQPVTHQTPKLPRGKVPVPQMKAQLTPPPRPQPSSPPVSASNRLSDVELALQLAPREDQEKSAPKQGLKAARSAPTEEAVIDLDKDPPPPPSPPRHPKAKSLRLSAGVKRGMLLCQAPPRPRTEVRRETVPRGHELKTASKEHNHRRSSKLEPLSLLDDDDPADVSNGIGKSEGTSSGRKGQDVCSASPEENSAKVAVAQPSPQPSFGTFDDLDLIHGLMHQQLIVTPPPQKPKAAPVEVAASDQPAVAPIEKVPAKKRKANEASASVAAAPKARKTQAAAGQGSAEKPQTRKRQNKKAPVSGSQSPPSVSEATSRKRSKGVSLAPTELPRPVSRDSSTSVSPAKKLALSTGGFHKKPKRVESPSANRGVPGRPKTAVEDDLSLSETCVPRPITVTVPPHTLRANRSGPLMTTTELSALLQKSDKPFILEDDPIEDGTQGDKNASPNRSFRRSHSENDAPIPSAADDWEKRNLTKPSKPGSNTSAPPAAAPEPQKRKAGGLAALIKKTDPRRRFQRTRSLNIDTNVPPAEEVEIVSPPPVDEDVGPWSTEAFDLFDWRPPVKDDAEQEPGVVVDRR